MLKHSKYVEVSQCNSAVLQSHKLIYYY